MFGEPLVIVRNGDGELNCLVNACRHRWTQVVDEGSGNKKVLMCPYHNWTYHLDGTLRSVTVEPIEGLDRANCSLRKIGLEVWQGTSFLNFDADAKSLAPQLTGLEKYIGRWNLGEMRTVCKTEYETSWNWKFSFETGNETYHHAGLHAKRIMEFAPPDLHEVLEFGDIWGIYGGKLPAKYDIAEFRMPLGRPPWMTDEEANKPGAFWSLFIAVYPGMITYISPHQISMITTQHLSMDKNLAATHMSVPQWALDNPNSAPMIEMLVQSMKDVQDEDTYGCAMLQKGVVSKYNDFSVHSSEV
jgi:phenylpropionate dioxygenase-like ring-hydroxylating dioxygenase large terminal subunit